MVRAKHQHQSRFKLDRNIVTERVKNKKKYDWYVNLWLKLAKFPHVNNKRKNLHKRFTKHITQLVMERCPKLEDRCFLRYCRKTMTVLDVIKIKCLSLANCSNYFISRSYFQYKYAIQLKHCRYTAAFCLFSYSMLMKGFKVGLSLSKKTRYLLHWKPFKNDEECILFPLKSSIRSMDI